MENVVMSNRSEGLGSSEIAAIVGLNPWEGPMDIYMSKLGLVEDKEESEAMWLGKEMEAVMDKRYEKETGLKPYSVDPIINPYESWRRGSPDRLVMPSLRKVKLIEYKTTGQKDGWGEPGTDQVPDHVACQVQWLLGLLPDVHEADVPVYFMGHRREFHIYHLTRDQEVIDSLVEVGRDFWFNHVLAQIPPPIDGSPGASEYLKRVYPRDVGDIIAAPPNAEIFIGHLKAAKERRDIAEDEVKEIENRLKAMIGDAAGLLGQGWKATWKKTKDRKDIDWKSAFYRMAGLYDSHQAEVDAIIQQHTTIKPGPRVFKIYEKKEGK